MAAEVTMIENIPVELNLGQPERIIGLASAAKDLYTGEITLEIKMDAIGSVTLEQLVEMLEVKSIGFAGIMRSPQDGR